MNLEREYKFLGVNDEHAKELLTNVFKDKIKSLRNLYQGATENFDFSGYSSSFYDFEKLDDQMPGLSNRQLIMANLNLNKENIVYNALSQHLYYYNYDKSVEKILDSEYAKELTEREYCKKVENPTVDKVMDSLISEEAKIALTCKDSEQLECKNSITDLVTSLRKKAEQKPIISLQEYDIPNSYSKDFQGTMYDCCHEIALDCDEGFPSGEKIDSNLPIYTPEFNKLYPEVTNTIEELWAEGLTFTEVNDMVREAAYRIVYDVVNNNTDTIYFNRFANAINDLDDQDKDKIDKAFEKSDISLDEYVEEYVDENSNSLERISCSDFIEELNEHCEELINENSNDLSNTDEHTPKM